MNQPRRLVIVLTVALLALASMQAWGQVTGPLRGGPPAASYPVRVDCNVPGATVYINGNYVGNTPYNTSLPPGSYSLVVRSQGYQDYSVTMQVNGPQSITAYLSGLTYTLSIYSNVNNAVVTVNGQNYGPPPVTLSAQPGVYNIQVTAGGYQTFSTQVNVSQNTTVNAQLIATFATLRFVFPESYFNPEFDRGRARNDIHIWVDGSPVGYGDVQVPAGRHTIRFTSGGWSVQGTYYFNAGQLYTVSPQLSIAVNPAG